MIACKGFKTAIPPFNVDDNEYWFVEVSFNLLYVSKGLLVQGSPYTYLTFLDL